LGLARQIVVAQVSQPACGGLPETDADVDAPRKPLASSSDSTENSEEPFFSVTPRILKVGLETEIRMDRVPAIFLSPSA